MRAQRTVGVAAAFLLISSALLLPKPAQAAGEALLIAATGNSQAIEAGRALYEQHCVICHGRQGGRGPNLFENTLTDQEFYGIVVGGTSGALGQMPSWAGVLTEKEVRQIEVFVKSRPHL